MQSTPMNIVDYLLSHLAQEANEIAIRCTKAQMFGLDEVQPEQSLTNRARLIGEINDFMALVDEMQHREILPRPLASERDWQAAIGAKQRKAQGFREYSRELRRLL